MEKTFQEVRKSRVHKKVPGLRCYAILCYLYIIKTQCRIKFQ